MRLTTNNIAFVKELTRDGVTYGWFVAMKSQRVSDARSYSYTPKFQLPVSVQRFIAERSREVFDEHDWHEEHYIHYIYR